MLALNLMPRNQQQSQPPQAMLEVQDGDIPLQRATLLSLKLNIS
jgi:hypothetical protein